MSKASDAKTAQGDDNYYVNAIQNKSQYIYWTDHNASGSNWGNAASGTTYTAVNTPTSQSLSGGSDGSAVTTGELKTAYELFQDADTVDAHLPVALP